MTISIAHLGPQGTYSELAALAYGRWLQTRTHEQYQLQACPSIAQALKAAATGETDLAIVPVENSIEGGVTVTLDTLWQLGTLHIHHALVMPIEHALISHALNLEQIVTVYSHPQALGQCQGWIAKHLAKARLVPTNSTAEALQHVGDNDETGAIASAWAAELHKLPTLVTPVSDHTDNCTKFWVVSLQPANAGGSCTSLAFSLPINAPGALLKPLQLFAQANMNLSRIESRPSKRSLGDYVFFLDIEVNILAENAQRSIQSLEDCTETLKILGCYDVLPTEILDFNPIGI